MDVNSYGQFQYEYDQHNGSKVTEHSTHNVSVPFQSQYQSLAPSNPWKRRSFSRFPWLGSLALIIASLSALGMTVVLVISNNSPVSNWTISPAVYLAIESTVANILLNYALWEGMTVSWWVKSIRPGASISDLHHIWSYGTSVKEALLSGRNFNLVALACITVAIAPLNGPLLQRASTITTSPVVKDISLTVLAAQEFPPGYTGIITGRAHRVGFITSNFSSVVQGYVQKVPVRLPNSGCDGRCSGTLQAAGYAISCTRGVQQFNLSSSLGILPDGSVNTMITNGTDIFATNFTYAETFSFDENGVGHPSFNFTSLYKTGGECWGDLKLTQCTLQPALLQYKIVIENDTISLDTKYSYKDDLVLRENPASGFTMQGPSTHGGMYLALDSLFSSTVHLRFTGAVGYELSTDGSPALQYALAGLNSPYECPTYWSDPTDDMLGAARELAFRTSFLAANASMPSNVQALSARSVTNHPIYHSNYLYLGLALVFTVLSAICIVPMFMGWSILGRDMSLSPIEIAKAFDAPILGTSDSNLAADELLKQVGDRPIKYGAVSTGYGAGYEHNGLLVGRIERLVFADPGRVNEPLEGLLYSG